MDIRVSLVRILQTDKVQLFVTKAVLKELSQLKESHPEAYRFAQDECEVFFSGGNEKLTPAASLEMSVEEKNKHHLFIATQDDELRQKLRRMPGVPIVLANRTMMLLEAPSDQNVSHGKQMEYHKSSGKSVEEQQLLDKAKAQLKAEKEERHSSMVKLRLKKQARGPNPLSMKKKKQKGPTPPNLAKQAKRAREANAEEGSPNKKTKKEKIKRRCCYSGSRRDGGERVIR